MTRSGTTGSSARRAPEPRPAPPGRPSLSIVVPAFNEARRIEAGMERLEKAAAAGAVDLATTELIVVDDGSTDDTAELATRLAPDAARLHVVRHPVNRGKGAAVRTGISLATAPAVIHMDADMAIDPACTPAVLEALATNEIAIGSRSQPESMVEAGQLIRSLMGRGFNAVVHAGTALRYGDTQCGFKGYRTHVARLVFHFVEIDRFAFDVAVLQVAARLGLRVAELPVTWRNVPGTSLRPLHDALAMVGEVVRARGETGHGVVLTAVAVRDPALVVEVEAAVARHAPGVPLPVLVLGPAHRLVLLAMLEPATVAKVADAVSALGAPGGAHLRHMTRPDLERLAPLAPRLESLLA